MVEEMKANEFQICGEQMEYEVCPVCDGDGYFDCYEEDPINFSPGEIWEKCRECDGKGFLLLCQNTPREKGGEPE